ncbi:dTDP-4-dehydrorhamnose reductase [Methylocella silvestris]|uniref:dTDP-4-dehydrorhamnose reductase n=1 Tax=Methylocella silvestris TaxID=199596 RepID=A0A2J7TE49_METSI|nr:dTDP-4-dehydrorhamnose reductase [Methylocella silvestris]PNG25023.1 dTDP-4-dehydrorhamnose reductase [Methylocella silvestris]
MTLRALLIGGSGQLGTELRAQAADMWDIVSPSHAELDVAMPDILRASVAAIQPDLIVNASAFHVVDLCENRFGDALAINALAVSNLAKAAAEVKARFVTISTDYAFDGARRTPYREADAPSPVQCYGVSKVAGEMSALAAHPDGALVVRSCGLYGHASSRQKGGNFVLNRLADARTRKHIEVGSDLVCTPTAAADLAGALITMIAMHAPAGYYHVTNEGACDWAAFTGAIFDLAKVSTKVIPVDRGGAYAPARRPPYSVLSCEKVASLGIKLPSWQSALARYVETL